MFVFDCLHDPKPAFSAKEIYVTTAVTLTLHPWVWARYEVR